LLVDLGKKGLKSSRVNLEAYSGAQSILSRRQKIAYEKKFDIVVRISNDVGKGSIVPDSTLELKSQKLLQVYYEDLKVFSSSFFLFSYSSLSFL